MPLPPPLRLCDPAALLELPATPPLTAGEVHLWAWPLAAEGIVADAAHALMSPDEVARARRFVRAGHQARFALAHGVLRAILGRYLDAPPEALRFTAGAAGKPALAGAKVQPEFNLSHTMDRAVLGVARVPIGVDVEHPRPRLDPLGMAARFFFGSEHEAIRRAPEAARRDTFLRYWVAKEAVLKAQGVGLGFPLDGFEVTFAADGASARIASKDLQRLDPGWTLRMLSLGEGWPVAVAAAGVAWRVRHCDTGTHA